MDEEKQTVIVEVKDKSSSRLIWIIAFVVSLTIGLYSLVSGIFNYDPYMGTFGIIFVVLSLLPVKQLKELERN